MKLRTLLLAGFFASGLSACGSTPTIIDEPSTEEGLQRVEVRNLDAVYMRPNADLAKYRRLLVRDVDISFSSGWERNQSGYPWNGADSERIKRELSELFAETVRRELQTEGGYEIVNEPGPDVLEVRPRIIDLYINAPDVSRDQPGIVRQYTTSAGRMTLVAELRDSLTGEVLARAYDKREDMRSTQWEWTTSITNAQKARQAVAIWADTLRDALDSTRSTKRVATR